YQTRSWRRPRRVLAMIEHTAQGPNVRFVVTNRRGRAADIFAWYHQRGQAENFIKELKRDLAAARLSCHAFRANAFRLPLHALAPSPRDRPRSPIARSSPHLRGPPPPRRRSIPGRWRQRARGPRRHTLHRAALLNAWTCCPPHVWDAVSRRPLALHE